MWLKELPNFKLKYYEDEKGTIILSTRPI